MGANATGAGSGCEGPFTIPTGTDLPALHASVPIPASRQLAASSFPPVIIVARLVTRLVAGLPVFGLGVECANAGCGDAAEAPADLNQATDDCKQKRDD